MADKLDTVNPLLAEKIKKILAAMDALGFPLKVIQGRRTEIYQHELWLQGRDVHGNIVDAKKIVTNADGYIKKSNHQSGNAVDCAFLDADGKVTFDEHYPWALYGKMGETLGLTWGGTFKGLSDLGHLELKHV